VTEAKLLARHWAQSFGSVSLLSMRWAVPQNQLTPRANSDLATPVTYFLLLLFLEVLMSMQNSAQRLSEKKREGGEGKEGWRNRKKQGGSECQMEIMVANYLQKH
jgi:hypothetical protein